MGGTGGSALRGAWGAGGSQLRVRGGFRGCPHRGLRGFAGAGPGVRGCRQHGVRGVQVSPASRGCGGAAAPPARSPPVLSRVPVSRFALTLGKASARPIYGSGEPNPRALRRGEQPGDPRRIRGVPLGPATPAPLPPPIPPPPPPCTEPGRGGMRQREAAEGTDLGAALGSPQAPITAYAPRPSPPSPPQPPLTGRAELRGLRSLRAGWAGPTGGGA